MGRAKRMADGENHELELRNWLRRALIGDWDSEQLPRAAGQVVVRDAPEERRYSFGVAVAINALEAVVWSLRERPADAAAGVRIETKRGIGYRLITGNDA